MSIRIAALRAAICCTLLATLTARAEVTSDDEYNKRLKIYQAISPGGETPFGEQINLYTGEVSFRQTDIRFPGIGPEITVTRSTGTSLDDRGFVPLAFGNWDLSLPRIETLVGPPDMWVASRCTHLGASALNFGWNGISLVTADGDRQPLLKRVSQYATTPTMTENGQPVAFSGITNANWQIGCLDLGSKGQGFLVVSPEGTKYYLTQLSYSEARTFRWRDEVNGTWERQQRSLATMHVSKIVDRFGNAVTFAYDPDDPKKLLSISASEGAGIPARLLKFTWRTDAPVISAITMQATDGTPSRTWQYRYLGVSETSAWLSDVILPDGTSWKFGGYIGWVFGPVPDNSGGATLANCQTRDASQLPTHAPLTGAITSPTGLTGTFEMQGTWHGRSYVPSGCSQITGGTESNPPIFGSYALVKRTLSGAGVAPQVWTYAYAPAQGSVSAALRKDDCAVAGTCPETAWVDIVDPEGDRTRHTFSNRWGASDGRLVKVETFAGASTLLRTETFAYASPTNGPWPARIGDSLDEETTTSNARQETWTPMSARNIAQQGVNFHWSATAFDEYAKPVTETRQTTGGVLKTDTTTWRHNTAKWVLGQVAQTTSKGDTFATPVITSRITYTDDLPTTFRAFEKVAQTVAYNSNGTVDTVADGRGNVTRFSDWKRGIPRLMSFADSTTRSATVDDFGQITAVVDENGFRTCHAFDVMGRLSKITHPSDADAGACGTDRWNPLERTFARRAANDPDLEFGLGPDHWIERVNTGNGHTVTHFDALWRPVVVERYDASDAATKSATFTRSATRYDASGAVVYQSYPTKNLTTYATGAPGTRTTYDALGRLTRVEQDSELGVLVSTSAYLAGFKTQSTNARGKVTTRSYQTFDQPDTDAPTTIVHPAGTYTVIERDLFGKPRALTRRDGMASVITTRSYSYNSAQELCRTIEPETGSTFTGYDAAGNVSWSAAGYASPGTSCLDAASVAGRRSDRTYDQRNRLTEITFADDLGEQVWEYTPDGLPRRITAYNGVDRTQPVITTYAYNNRRMVGGQGETSQQAGWYLFSLGTGFDRNGALANHVYTGGEVVDYAPNALGQATRVGAYANSVAYHPNGAISRFNYGNGLGHALDQNVRGLPDRSRDAYGANVILDDSYDYDETGNVVAISDGLSGARGNRDMAYDDLDRLVSASSPMFGGTINYTYDVLDNLQTVSGAGRDLRYCYNSTSKRLEFLRTAATNCFTGSATTNFGFDVQGNLAWKNQQHFKFSLDNRLRESVGVATYRYDGQGRRVSANNPTAGGDLSWMYSNDGKLRRLTDARRTKLHHYMYLGESLVAIREQDFSGNLLGIKYQHTDALGTPVAVSGAGGVLIERSEYEPYGKLLNRPLGDVPGFTGHVQDADTGLTYMQQRYYDPVVGRFLSVDAVTAYSTPGENFNRYWYANNNPFKFTDPDGRSGKIVRFGLKLVKSGGDVKKASKDTFVEVADSVATIADPSSSAVDKGLAVFDLASPISSREIKAGVDVVFDASNDVGKASRNGGAASTLKPGPFAGDSIPVNGPGRANASQRSEINRIGQGSGCHTCGSTIPGTTSGNHVMDHQPPSSLNPAGSQQRGYPHCIDCSRRQGGEVNAERRRRENE